MTDSQKAKRRKTKTIAFRLTLDEAAQLEKLVKDTDRISDFVRDHIRALLKK